MNGRIRRFKASGAAAALALSLAAADAGAQQADAPAALPTVPNETAAMGEIGVAETHIAVLRAQLHIAAAQEAAFKALAEVMRANAKVMEQLESARGRPGSVTAPAAVRWSLQAADARAAALKKFEPAFLKLYAQLSKTQQKSADALFGPEAEVPVQPKAK